MQPTIDRHATIGASISAGGHEKEVTSTGASTSEREAGVKVDLASGVASIFLISRSNCAFVNYTSERALMGAVDWFNGRPLRSAEVSQFYSYLGCWQSWNLLACHIYISI